jgi:hypothetical protein
MSEKLRFLGMDVHAETIAVAIAEPYGIGAQADEEAWSSGEVAGLL